MKHRFYSILTMVSFMIFVSGFVVAVSADSMSEVITGVGTTQSFIMEEVPEEDILIILEAGLSAASAINQQPWFFVAITNQDVMREIAGTGMGGKEGMPGPGSMPEGMEKPDFPVDEQGMENVDAPDMGNGAPAGPPASSSARASLGDSPLAIIVYKNPGTSSPDPDFDCGLAAQNMVLAASSMGYGVKIVSSPTMSLNGADHDRICEELGVDPGMEAVAVLLIGMADESADAVSSASTRDTIVDKTSIIR